MALSKIVENSITDGVVSSAKLKDFAAAVDLNGVELILDADQDTSITADTDDRIDFKLGGVEHISLNNSSGDTVIKPMVDAKDIIFQQYDGNKILEINDGNYVGIGGNAAGAGEIRIYEDTDNGSHYTGFKAGNNTASVAYVLPTADGSASQALITDGSGTLSWSTISTALDDLTAGDAAVTLATSAGNITIDAQGNDTDIIFKGTDGGADTTYMTIDGSAGGDLFLTGGLIDLKNDGSAVSQIKFYCESSNAHAQTLIGAPHSESATNTLTLPSTGGNSYLLTAASTATVTNKTFTSPKINEDVAVTATATELNLLDGVSGLVQADLTKLAAVDSTAAELNIVDGGTSATSTTVADADRVVMNDNGTMVQVAVTDLAAYFDDEITAMPNLTSVGTLTALTVDDVAIDGKVMTMTGSSSDTFVVTVGTNGATSLVTTDAAAAAANLQITADGTVDIDSAGVLTLDSGAAINIEPASGSAILLDGTISIDAGVVTGATSVTSTAFVGNLTGTVATATQNSITTATGLTTVGATGTASSVAGIPFFSDTSNNSIYTHDVSGTDSTAEGNTAYGLTALDAVTTGDYNTAIGFGALTAHTTGEGNTAVGQAALNANTTGSDNTALGKSTLIANTTGSRNIGIGNRTNDLADTENDNVAIGYQVMTAQVAGAEQTTAIGNYALDALTSGDKNTAVGYQAASANTSAENNTAVGVDALLTNTDGSNNTAIGTNALKLTNSGTQNVAVGHNALTANTSASQNTAVGQESLKANTTGTSNVAVGAESLKANTTADNNTAVGMNSLLANTTGAANTGLGSHAFVAVTTGSDNVAVGVNAGVAITTSSKNVLIGNEAGYANTSGYENTFIGYQAYRGNTTGNHNVAVGSTSAYYGQGRPITGSENTYVGARTNSGVEAQAHQIVLGFEGRPSHSSSDAFANFHHGNGTYSKIQLGQTSITGSSDQRLKQNIADSTAGLAFINDLRPRTFKFKKQKDISPTTLASYKEGSDVIAQGGDASTFYGFVAQEIKTAIDAHSIIDDGHIWEEAVDGCQNVAQGALVPMLVKAIQELSTKVQALEDA